MIGQWKFTNFTRIWNIEILNILLCEKLTRYKITPPISIHLGLWWAINKKSSQDRFVIKFYNVPSQKWYSYTYHKSTRAVGLLHTKSVYGQFSSQSEFWWPIKVKRIKINLKDADYPFNPVLPTATGGWDMPRWSWFDYTPLDFGPTKCGK